MRRLVKLLIMKTIPLLKEGIEFSGIKAGIIILILITLSVASSAQSKYPRITSDSALARHLPTLSNWGKWKDTDELGSLNYLTHETTLQARTEIRTGVTITLARKVAMTTEGMRNPQYTMQKSDLATRDYVGAIWHGFAQTHLDALCHIFADSMHMYNGLSTASVDSTGCKQLGIDKIAAKGITGRGVLIDMGYLNGAPLEPGTAISIKQIETALQKQRTVIKKGDIVFIRTGAGWKNTRDKRAGLHPECLFWVKEKQISLLGSDGDGDVAPLVGFDRYASAFHAVAIPWMGMPLIDNADLDALSQQCIRLKRWTFFVVVAPWNIKGATSAPINPVAVF
jgi:kynurenine formamidase